MKKRIALHAVLVAALASFLAGCGADKKEPLLIQVGDPIVDPKNSETVDGRSLKYLDLPSRATEVTYRGNGWLTFKLDQQCFLLAYKGRASVLANMDCQ